ncbi:MAG: DNA repair protein RecO [Muribaculaceae bacterium]|nr:DNA repair protein RecO [Muribaculaceae bacterium]
MYQHLDCISLRITRYNDRHSILTALSRQQGRLSLLISAGSGREATRRRALLRPGGRFSCEADLRDVAGRIPPIRDVAPRGDATAAADPVQSIITLFLVDFLNSILRDSQPDPLLFDFADSMLGSLETATGRRLANFHLLFLIKISRYLGVEPDQSTYRRGYVFDMTDAVFRPTPPIGGTYLDPAESEAAARLMRISRHNLHLYALSAAQRNRALDVILQYYTLHFASLRSMKSVEVVRSLFH